MDNCNIWGIHNWRYNTNTMTNGLLNEEPDWIVLQVMKRMSDRSAEGIKKYNCTMMRDDVSTIEWIDHAIEESLDHAVYLERLKYDLSNGGRNESAN